ncbi:hypothetical protein DSO57_1006836 [Entomophthora muscae]|uniref:Uncharacterized protein n=1 Tax=Entomophthora muscae TaxID=34485 RepID=A0ACC2TUY0_9FUNG|nr:hypothetical protein DSO57_1006836 [Entomophthora muscae]
MQFTFVPLFLALTSAQQYSGPSTCRPIASGMILDCGSQSDAFQLKDVILKPSVPVAGQPLDIHLIGNLKQEIASGSTASISPTVNGAQLGDVNLDICKLAKERNLKVQCPVKPMKVDMDYSFKIPAYAPKGTYDISAYGFNQEKVRIFNITIKHSSQEKQV